MFYSKVKLVLFLSVIVQNTCGFVKMPPSLDTFRHWHCVDFIKNIDATKPYAYNVGDLPLVVWFNNTKQPVSTLNICKHMGSRLDSGTVKDGCLICPYHGLQHSHQSDAFGSTVVFQDKLWWSYNPYQKKPPAVPFYNNKEYETAMIKVEVNANIVDCAFNTMDVNHPAFVHNNLLGFGSNVPPTNLQTIRYNDQKLGLTFQYKSNSNIVHLKRELKTSNNYHVYEYPYTTWSRVSLSKNGKKEHLFVCVNMLPMEADKTRWMVTLKHNFWNKSEFEKKLMQFAANCILFQDQQQMARQAPDNFLKHLVMHNVVLENEEHIKDFKQMFRRYKYPSMIDVIKLVKYDLEK